MIRGGCLGLLVALTLTGCGPSSGNGGIGRKTPTPSPSLAPAACSNEDVQKLYASVEQFVEDWNLQDGKRLDSLFAPNGWIALSKKPRQREMVTVSGRQLDKIASLYWAQGATLRYTQILPGEPKPGDTLVGTSIDGLTMHFPDGIDVRTDNKFVVWCNYHALGQGVIYPL